MAQEFDTALCKLTLLGIRSDPCLLKLSEDFSEMVIVLLSCVAVYEDIIHHAHHSTEFTQNLRHAELEVFRSQCDPKWKSFAPPWMQTGTQLQSVPFSCTYSTRHPSPGTVGDRGQGFCRTWCRLSCCQACHCSDCPSPYVAVCLAVWPQQECQVSHFRCGVEASAWRTDWIAVSNVKSGFSCTFSESEAFLIPTCP